MSVIAVIVLMIVCARLWQRTGALELRLMALEVADPAGGRTWFEPDPAPVEHPVYRPAPRVADPIPEPAPADVPQSAFIDTADTGPDEPRWQAPRMRGFSFEHVFGRYLPIWAGGITLAVAGFLIVKYSIDAGLLSPVVRVICGLLFGSGLIAAAEAALRRDDVVRDARIRQALSGAGVATLYAAILVAANVYLLIGPMTAFVGLAGVTMLAGLLSLRFGAPSAVLGLVGGLAAPALVGSDAPNVPLLATYLALTVGGLSVLGRAQRWWWLGALAVAGGFGWGLLLIAAGLHNAADTLSVGALTLALAIAFPLAIVGTQSRLLRLGAGVAGCAQMAAIVATGGFAPLEWALYGLISAAVVWLSHREERLAGMPVVGLVVGVLLSVAWPDPAGRDLAVVMTVGALIYGLPALWRVWRANGTSGDAVQLAIIAAGTTLIPIAHSWWQTPRGDFAPLALLGAAIAGGAAAIGWRVPDRDARFAILSVPAILLLALAIALAAPVWALGMIVAFAAIAALLLAVRADDRWIGISAHAIFGAAIILLVLFDANEAMRAFGMVAPSSTYGLVRWSAGALAAIAFARFSRAVPARHAAEGGAVLFAYVALAQIVPSPWLALVPAAMLGGLAFIGHRRAALGAAAALAAAWAIEPLGTWLIGGAASLTGLPFYASDLPGIDDTLIRIAAPAAALIAMLWRRALPQPVKVAAAITATVLATVTTHVLWKQLFMLDPATFDVRGMAERTLWEALLLGAAVGAWRLSARRVAIGLGVAALLHFGWYTAAMHNPLWSEQLAGPWLVPAYAIAFALVWLSARVMPGEAAGRGRDAIRMALILLLAASLLRQVFHGSLLSAPGVSQAEDIGRSLLAIGLAIGFLQWGIRRSLRDWRIASLVLMLVAVGKVFLIDAAGLDGLLRIGSFAALGFSLIGVGWLYSRYLPDPSSDDGRRQPFDRAM